jgi:hypothetical protein
MHDTLSTKKNLIDFVSILINSRLEFNPWFHLLYFTNNSNALILFINGQVNLLPLVDASLLGRSFIEVLNFNRFICN